MPVLAPSLTRTRTLLVVLAAVSLVALFTTRVSRKMPDFQVYWTAGARALAAQPLYRADDGHYQFKYLPAFALAMVPFGDLDADKTYSTFERAGAADKMGVNGAAGIYIDQEVE